MAPSPIQTALLDLTLWLRAWRLALTSDTKKGRAKRQLVVRILCCCFVVLLAMREFLKDVDESPPPSPDEALLMMMTTQPRKAPKTATEKIRMLADKEGFLSKRPSEPITVAYAISLIKCSDRHSTPAGLIDAALTLRHSVHLTSSRNENRSHYDYEMFAIVHEAAESCSHVLKDAGFRILIQNNPVQRSEIKDDTLRKDIRKALCCGEDEFIKLFAYHLTEYPIVVHSDMDFLYFQPMDTVFDAMLYSPESTIGRTARENLPVEFASRQQPRNITALITRDWPQVRPGRIPAYQAGLMIVQPDPAVFDTMIEVVRTHSYTPGFGRDNGWGGLGYGAFIGSMAMQGLVAYVYDTILNGTTVELNHCNFNHMGMNTRGNDGKCRNNQDQCEDCMVTPVSNIFSAHYTMCRKPWACIGESRKQRNDKKSMIDGTVIVDHCFELQKVWHKTRNDFEDRLSKLTGDASILESRSGSYFPDVFQGHCANFSSSGYLRITGQNSSFQRIPELYK